MRALSIRPITKALLKHHALYYASKACPAPYQQHIRCAQTTSATTNSLIPLHSGPSTQGRSTDDHPSPQPPNLRPALAVQHLASAWADIVEAFLPVALRKPTLDGASPIADNIHLSPSVVTRLLLDAWRVDADVLSYLGLEEGRWEAMMWLARLLVDTSPTPNRTQSKNTSVSNLQWPSVQTLDDLTRSPFVLGHNELPHVSNNQSLRNFTVYGESAWQASLQKRGKQALGHIWQTLGRLIIAAAERDAVGSNIIMSYVLQIIANLHHRGWIPEKTYQYTPNEDPSAMQQPPLLHSLSHTMLSSLSDHDYHNRPEMTSHVRESAVGAQSLSEFTEEVHSTADGQHLGPELWMEFVLWCCVHGPWLEEGAAVVAEIYKLKKPNRWSLICWRDIMESPDSKWEDYSRRRLDAKHEGAESRTMGVKSGRSRTIVERTISTEVVVALIDGLLTSLTKSQSATATLPLTEIQKRISTLKAVLERDKMSLGLTTWDAVITRFADCPDFHIENNPQIMEMILSLAETYGREVSAANAPQESESPNPLATYVFDASAATIGLYHRTLQAFIKFRDMSGALRLLARLQTLTDANKNKSLQEFFRELNATRIDPLKGIGKIRGVDINFDSMFPGVQYPGFHPNIPVNILADLLDLISDSGSVELGHWMIYSNDIDGPLITEDLYGHQLMAPALIRFAATTSDARLLSRLTRAQSTTISGRTLVALCDSRIREGNWVSAANILSLIRDHSLHSWSPADLSTLIRPLLAHLALPAQEASYTQASTLLQKLLRGDLGQVWGPDFAQLDTIVGIVTSINPSMADLCAGLLIPGKQYKVALGTFPFNNIVQGAVNAFGSRTGRDLWLTWCLGTAHSRQVELAKDPLADSGMETSNSGEVLHSNGHHQDADTPSADIETELVTETYTTDEETSADLSTSSYSISHRLNKRRHMTIAEAFGQPTLAQASSGDAALISDQNVLASADSTPANALHDIEVLLGGHDKHGNAKSSATFTGYIPRQISSLRIIIQKALIEHRVAAVPDTTRRASISLDDTDNQPFARHHEILDWAARVLGEDFGFPTAQIHVELEGYLSGLNLALPVETNYSKQTLQIWTAFSGSWKQWVFSKEEKLRNFALNKIERQIVFDDVPAAERYFLHCLAADFGMVSESFGEARRRAVVISKTPKAPTVPSRTVDEVMRGLERKPY